MMPFFFGGFPVDGDGGFDLLEPAVVNDDEVIAVDFDFGAFFAAVLEGFSDKGFERLGVFIKGEVEGFGVYEVADFMEDLLKFSGAVVGGGYFPVEVVGVKEFLDVGVGDEGDFFGVEGANVEGRQVLVKEPFFSDGEDELGDGTGDVAEVFFSLCPEVRG